MIVRKLEALFTINTNAAQFKKATSELDRLASRAETVMKAIAGYWAVQALQNFVTNTANAMAEIGKSAEYIGIGAEALQELRYAAEKSGVSMEALNDALKEIQVRATDAKSGQGEAAEAFKMLGLKSTDAAGRIREPLELLDAVADRLKALPTHSERIWVADAIFGDEGSTVIKMLKDGSVGLQKLRQEARDLGVVLDSESTAKAARFGTSLKGLKATSQITANAFVQGLMRPLSWLMEKVSALADAFNQLDNRASLVRVTLLSLSGIVTALAIKGGLMLVAFLAPFAPLMLAIAGVVAGIIMASIVIEDLWVAFQGGESVIKEKLQKCVAFFKNLGNSAQETWHAMTKGFGDVFDGFRQKIAGIVDIIKSKFALFGETLTKISLALKNSISNFFAGLTPNSMTQWIADSLTFIQEKFAAFQDWITGAADALKARLANTFNGLMPDFVKKGFLATIKHVSSPNSNSNESQNFNARLAPTPGNVLHHNRVSTNQNVNVAVNVKSGANPQDIGTEVAKVFRKEFERERFNAFMGVTQYAG